MKTIIEKVNKSLNKFFKKLTSDTDKYIKHVKQEFSAGRPKAEEIPAIIRNVFAGEEDPDSPYQHDIQLMKEYAEMAEKTRKLREDTIAGIDDPDKRKTALEILDAYTDSLVFAEQLKSDTKEIETMFSDALSKLISGTENAGDIMKGLFDDVKNYFIKSFSDAVAKGLMDSVVGKTVSGGLNLLTGGISGGIDTIFDFLGGLFKHHSGGYIIPGTEECLSVLKGGERVLSPAENISYTNNNGEETKKNIVVNNFNIKSWDSRDVGQYLIDHKDLIAGITAENIRYNQAGLRNMIGI